MTKTVDDMVAEYVQLRDEISNLEKKHKEAIKPLRNRQEEVAGWLQKFLDTSGADNVGTKHGTCYTTTKYSAPLADPEAFMQFIVTNNLFELLDRKANVTAVKEYVLENKALPPGVNLTQFKTVNVRRAS